jgi:hypothetical protein
MRILSYSLFQSPSPVYWRSDNTQDRMSAYMRFLPVLVRAHHAIWPGYELRIYHDDAVRSHPYFSALSRMHDRGLLRLMPCGGVSALTLAMLWRMRPLFDEHDHLSMTCDIDSFPLIRLRRMVEEFALSDKAVMLVHGCESHNGVLGGGFGARGIRFRDLVGTGSWEGFIKLGKDQWKAYAADEEFLRITIWPRVVNDAIVFSSNQNMNISVSDKRQSPSVDFPGDILPVVRDHGDDFAPYIGSAGYDVMGAFNFYQGLPLSIMQLIRECETESIDLNKVMNP